MTIEEAKQLLIKEGYYIKKITEAMEERMDKCANEGCDCCGCCCNICILND